MGCLNLKWVILKTDYTQMEILLKKETKIMLGQQMYQSMNLLQMSAVELDSYLNELSMENPLLEEKPPVSCVEDRYINIYSSSVKKKNNGDSMEIPIVDNNRDCLCSYLEEQLYLMHLEESLENAVKLLIINLDKKGYLPELFLTNGIFKNNEKLFTKAHEVLKSMDPPGVGALDLSDCLCIQLERLGKKDSLAYILCEKWLEHLAKDHINHISKALSVSEAKVVEAKEQIKNLNPIPANGYNDGSSVAWAIPDVEIEFEDGEPVIYSSERYMPSYGISASYRQMAENSNLSDEEREYFREKLAEAQWAVNSVKRRRDTLMRCVSAIVDEQRVFFEYGSMQLRPYTMSDLAEQLGIHQSTVSRAMKNKYISCKWGLFPISYLFAQEVCGETADNIGNLIKEIISGENPKKPMSDNDISKKLAERGYNIARRTVAKYRENANIPSATGRKIR